MLAQIVPVQGGDTSLTSGGVDFIYIRANTDSRTTSQTISDVETMRDAMDAYYRRNSRDGSFVDAFAITPVYDLPQSFTSLGQLTDAMRAAAAADGFVLNDYTRFAYGFPNPEFGFGGGALGGGSATSGSLWIPDGVFSSGADSASRGVVHESLHSLGLGHANNLEFQDQVFETYTGLNSENTQAGIDPYHFMGGEGFSGLDADIAAYQKYYIGWLEASNVTVAPDDPTGVYRIYDHTSSNIPSDRKVALQIGDDGPEGAVWLSYDPDNPNPEVLTKGVIATYVDPIRPAVPWLLDLTPNSRQPYDPDFPGDVGRQVRVDLFDAAATVGQTSAIPELNFTFTPIATGGSGEDKWVDIEVSIAEVLVTDRNQSVYQYDLGAIDSQVESGYDLLSPITAGDLAWTGSGDLLTGDTGVFAGALNRDYLESSQPAGLEAKVRDGLWRVTITTGDASAARDDLVVRAEGATVLSGIDTAVNEFATHSFDVEVTDGSLSLEFSDDGGLNDRWVLNSLELEMLEHRVDLEQNLYRYDFGPEGSLTESRIFLGSELITPDAAGDISWSSPVQGVSNAAIFIVDGVTYEAGALNDGIVAADGATGSGFILLTEEPVATRFAANLPVTNGNIATNLLAVRFRNGQWEYSNNLEGQWFAFTPVASDRLLASINYSTDTISSLEGQRSTISGIEAGFDSGGLTFFADQFAGQFDNGDFQVTSAAGPDAGPIEQDWIGAAAASTLEHRVKNGRWRVTLRMGDAQPRDDMQVWAEGSQIAAGIATATGQYVYIDQSGASLSETSFDVEVTDGSLSLEFRDTGGTNLGWVVNGMTLERVGAVIDTTQTSFSYDLGSPYGIVEDGFELLSDRFREGDVRFSSGSLEVRDRYRYFVFTDPQPQFADFVAVNGGTRTLEHAVANGAWRVTMTLGDALPPNRVTNASVRAENELIASGLTTFIDETGPTPVIDLAYVTRQGVSLSRASFDIEVLDGSLSLEFSGNWRLSTLELEKIADIVPPPLLTGDFNNDFAVDAADYTVWRDALGTSATLPNDPTPGVVDGSDYLVWRDNYGSVLNLIGPVVEAEDAITQSGVTIGSNVFAGVTYVDFGAGGFIEWEEVGAQQAGVATLTFRYANGAASNRPADILINGASVGTIAFPPTGGALTFAEASIEVPLKAGGNTIRVASPGDGPRLDRMTVGEAAAASTVVVVSAVPAGDDPALQSAGDVGDYPETGGCKCGGRGCPACVGDSGRSPGADIAVVDPAGVLGDSSLLAELITEPIFVDAGALLSQVPAERFLAPDRVGTPLIEGAATLRLPFDGSPVDALAAATPLQREASLITAGFGTSSAGIEGAQPADEAPSDEDWEEVYDEFFAEFGVGDDSDAG